MEHPDYSLFYYFLIWISLFTISLAFITVHGIDYVAWPRLNPPTDIIYYSGPGFRSGHHGKGLGSVSETKLGLGRTAKWLNSGRRRRQSRVGMEEGDIPLSAKKRVD
jgi:hypothetical protein